MQVRGSKFESLAPTLKTNSVWVYVIPVLFQGNWSKDRKGPGSYWSTRLCTPWKSSAEDPVSVEKVRANMQGGPLTSTHMDPHSHIHKTLWKSIGLGGNIWQCSSSESLKLTWEEAQSEKRAHIFWDLLGIQEMRSGSTSKALALTQEPHCKPIQIVVAFTNLLHFHVHVCVCTRVNVMWPHVWWSEDCVLESVLSQWVLGVDFGSWGLAASPFTHRTILPAAPPLFLWSENSECNPGWPWQAILRIWGTIGRHPCGHLLCLSFVCLFVCLSFWSDKISWGCLCGHRNFLHCHFPAQDYLSARYSACNLS